MTDLIHILHNTGAFGYRVWPLVLFALECLALLLAALWILGTVSHLAAAFARRKRARWSVIIVALFAVVFSAVTFPGAYSKICFAQGYGHYLAADLPGAGRLYLKAARLDRNFSLPLEGLVAICTESQDADPLIQEVEGLVRRASRGDLCARIARRLGAAGRHAEAAELYAQAQRISGKPVHALGKISEQIAMSDRQNAEEELARLDGTRLDPGVQGEHQYLTALLAMDGDRLSDALGAIQRAIAAEPARPQYYVTSGEILMRLAEPAKAVQQWEEALHLRPDLPAAHFALGTHYYRLHEVSLARQSLEKVIYYDNGNSRAAVLLELLKQQRSIPLEQIHPGRSLTVRRKPEAAVLACQVGETVSVDLELAGVSQDSELFVTALEPYGFGVQAEVGQKLVTTNAQGQTLLQFSVKLHARRPDRVNLNMPWEVNLVAGDLTTGAFADHRLRLSVREKPGEEGRVLFVITQDHEQTSGFGQSGAPPGVPHVTAAEARTELVEKLDLANELARKQGVRWSHVVDIGSSVLRLKWAQSEASSPDWQGVWPAMHDALLGSLAQGHDVQLHIHGYNVPGNRLSRQVFDPASQTIRFADNLSRKQGPGETHGSWADNFTDFGTWTEKESRVGSLFQGLQLLEGELHETHPDYRVLFFRAGEYEFGRDKAAMAASIQALRMNQILAGSDAHGGSPYRRDFKFHRPVGRNVYFTASDRIDEPAASLLDVGILEMLPVPERFGHDHLSPLSSLRSVQENYQRCLTGTNVRSGVFLLLEMYHLNSANQRSSWDNLDPNFSDWKQMAEQFSQIKKACPKIEFVTISEAIKLFLDQSTPDIVPLRTNERKMSPNEYRYDLQLLGKDIGVGAARPHFVAVKPPSYFVGRIARLEIWYGDEMIQRWDDVADYRDLAFKVTATSGYTMRLTLNG